MNRISDLTRRLWAALLALCLVLALTLPVFAEGESGTADTAEKETFHIGTVDDLLQLADSCRLDSWSKNRTVYLDADLELTGSGFAGIPSFSGVFEGQGHTISGLSLVDDGSVIGFFRYVQQGAMKMVFHSKFFTFTGTPLTEISQPLLDILPELMITR